jgi:uncharacterized membrane protein
MDGHGTYVSQSDLAAMRKQARNVWAVLAAIAGFWLFVIVLPPFLVKFGYSSAASPIYTFYSFICHQIPERSLHIFGHQLAVCSRCFGVYCGLLLGLLTYPLWRAVDDIEPFSRIWLILSLVPISVDWSLTIFGIWENTHLSRFITGAILGIACGIYILPAVVEIKRNYGKW